MVAGGSTVYACPVLILCYVSVPGCHCWKQDAELDPSLVSSAMNEKRRMSCSKCSCFFLEISDFI